MNILYITDCYYMVNSGAKTSARAHLRTLCNLYGENNVSVIALVGNYNPDDVDKKHMVIRGSNNKVMLLVNCFRGYSTYLTPKGLSQILNEIKEHKPDMVFVDNSILGKLVKRIKEDFPEIFVVSYYHDVKAKLARDWRDAASFFKKPVYSAMISNEAINAQYCDVNFVLGDREEKLYERAYHKKPEAYLSVYMDIDLSDNYKNRSYADGLRLLFFGGYYLPNVHGIDWFVEKVFPKLPANCELLIAGRGMDKLLEKNYPDRVTVKGFVDDLETMYRDVDIVISPIFEGGGMKVKVAEAMAYGKVIIGSNESYEGYQEKITDDLWGKYFYRANTEEEFAAIITDFCNNGRPAYFNQPIRDLYEEGFSEKYAQRIISEVVDKFKGKQS